MKKYSTITIIFCLLLTSMPLIASNQSDQTILYVDDDNTEGPWDGSSTHPFRSINDALSHAENNTFIFIKNGYYPEQINVEKSISFVGENKEETIIDGENLHAVFIIETVAPVTIDNVTITNGSDTDSKLSAGIVLIQASHSIITNCVIQENDVGVLISQDSSNCIIYQNDIKNNNLGIDLCTSTHTLIYGNTIEENTVNLVLYNSSDNLITKNNIMNGEKNIQFYHSKDTVSTNYWGTDTNIYFFFGYQFISAFDIFIPWFKCDRTPVSTKDGFIINPLACIDTTMGSMIIELYQDQMPITATNFIQLAEMDFFENLVFHRVIDDFVIQGGGYYANGTLKESPLGMIDLEIHPDITHVDGAISMARTSDPNSATSQFFICDGAQDRLDGEYAAFGTTIVGLEVLRAIASVETETRFFFMQDWPVEDIIIQNVAIIE